MRRKAQEEAATTAQPRQLPSACKTENLDIVLAPTCAILRQDVGGGGEQQELLKFNVHALRSEEAAGCVED